MTVKDVAGRPPKVTPVTLTKLTPLTVTRVPPMTGPDGGFTPVTAGSPDPNDEYVIRSFTVGTLWPPVVVVTWMWYTPTGSDGQVTVRVVPTKPTETLYPNASPPNVTVVCPETNPKPPSVMVWPPPSGQLAGDTLVTVGSVLRAV